MAVLCLFAGSHGYAQTGLTSPYSSRGIGYPVNANTVMGASMGDLSLGIRNHKNVNFRNPASYTALDSLSFVFEGAVKGQWMKLTTIEQSEKSFSSTMEHMVFGFPVSRWWSSGVGLVPFVQTGYRITDENIGNETGNVRHKYEGSGGLHSFFWGNSFSLFKNLSVGINASYLFGTIEKSQYITFPDSIYYLSTKVSDEISAGDIMADMGLQLTIPMKNELQANLGAVYHPATDIRAKRDFIAQTYLGTISNVEIIKDTVDFDDGLKGNIGLPQGFGVGLALEKKNQWLFGLDYTWDEWSKLTVYEDTDSLRNSQRIMVGGMYLPSTDISDKYWKHVEFRAGAYYSSSYLNIGNQQLDDFGISFGLGLPLFRSESMLNLSFTTGRRGTTRDQMIRENYSVLRFGITVYEIWFMKRRYY
ncbi:MAG: hypothetical protein JW861_09435 [Bacteroidales bacterium]|nr:hypothetical protein [Bacteroidales bacterium]